MNTEDAIEKLAAVIGQSASITIDQYLVWHLADSIAWILFGATMIYLSRFVPQLKEDDPWFIPRPLIVSTVIFVGSLLICVNIGNVFAPKAAAIHQLILDIRD